MKSFFVTYLVIGMIVAIPLARGYWRSFRESDHKSNVVMPMKFQNRIIDSFVFTIAWMILVFIYPVQIAELIFKQLKKRGKRNG